MTANPRPKGYQTPNTGFADALLDWYDRHARDLPWRVGPAARAAGVRADPYRVWLSEIMLQQTTVPHGTRYFLAFTDRWPTVEDLAAAEDADVMAAWAGLGYYARARNLLKCAREVVARGGFPETRAELMKLPGVGPYTSGAIAAIAFGEQVPAVDGNVDRVFARQLALKGRWRDAKVAIAAAAAEHVPENRPGEFAEAVMDLGATLCTPKRPNCLLCPVADSCSAKEEGEPERYPIKDKAAPKPRRSGHAFVAVAGDQILLEQRPDRGLLGGMLGLPGSDWTEGDLGPMAAPLAGADWSEMGEVRHVFTHFELTLTVWRAEVMEPLPLQDGDQAWKPRAALDGLPSVFKKAARLALG